MLCEMLCWLSTGSLPGHVRLGQSKDGSAPCAPALAGPEGLPFLSVAAPAAMSSSAPMAKGADDEEP